MRIGFLGLAHSHPFTDAGVARSLGVDEVVVWSDEPARLARFRTEHACRVAASPAALLAARPDVVVVTVRPAAAADAVGRVLAAGVPCFGNKLLTADQRGLDALDAAVAQAPDRFLTTSVLRFAPAVAALSARIEPADVLTARAEVAHDIGAFLTPERRWQDVPATGGGTLISVGLHGIEMLDAVLRPATGLAPVAGVGATRMHDTASEDVGVLLLRGPDDLPATVEVVGVGAAERYAVTLHTRTGRVEAVLDGADPLEALGYRGTMRAVLRMAGGAPSEVAWARSRAVLHTAILAAETARS
ncbi:MULTISPECIES: hypothetical protein [Actinoalloteichus]|uniref:Oxidoreductase n=1 Tax=Actinoalloteichus fjordicus TaxID=1612552 RepID=A0AAC9PTD5_9PSEU|nr:MULTISPECIES: hypothetical protein [Actinoalloteichus]APU15771.1 hypothetical protein UA74_18715 [Actinoalloteichus fjordicus]APU21831.1 hypothetical protein UA75_19205 [Actinoalloteichus sp. GBA129-24]